MAKKKTTATHRTQPAAANLEASPLPVEPKPETQWVEVDADELALLDAEHLILVVNGDLLKLAASGGQEACHDAFDIFAKMTPEERRLTRRAAIRLEEWVDSYLIGNGK